MLALAGIAAIFCRCRDDPAAANPAIPWILLKLSVSRSDPTFRGHRVAQASFQRYAGFRSREEHTFAEKVLSAIRQGFGGHIGASPQDSGRKGDKA